MRHLWRQTKPGKPSRRARPAITLLVLSISLVAICLFGSNQAIWAEQVRVSLCQILPTVPPHGTATSTQPQVTATASPTSTAGAQVGEEAITSPTAVAPAQSGPPISFRTPVYGISSTSSGDQSAAPADGSVGMRHSERSEEAHLQDSFAKIFPVWCVWPIVGLILIAAGMDLRTRSHQKRQ